jgi:acetylornithine deacetylase/succinyl-diaminopimelate desuccinylase-like protein
MIRLRPSHKETTVTNARDERDWMGLGAETTELLSALIRIDTTNDNETAAAELVRSYLASAGVESRLVGELPRRQNLVARLPGRRQGPTLLLLGHTDVVPAEPDEWSVPPFSGIVKDGWVWGRGALDMKNQIAAQAVALARLARDGADFAGDVVYVATCDEENGQHCGARWLVENEPELVRCDYLLNEGGGEYSRVDGGLLYPVTVGEKAFADFRITVRGQGGHGSVPLHDKNAVERLARVIAALADHQPEAVVQPLTAAYIDVLIADEGLRVRLKDPTTARGAIADMHAADDPLAYAVEPLLGVTFSPTVIHAGSGAVNVIPSHAEVDVDCRILPEQRAEDVEREVRRALAGIDGWEFDWVDVTVGNESPLPTPLSESLERVLVRSVPEAKLVGLHLSGFTDSRWFREAFPEAVAYGFCPFVDEDTDAMGDRCHSADERVSVADLAFQAYFFEQVTRDLLR